MIPERRYNSINLLKIIMAICVIAIHTQPLYNCGSVIATRLYESVVGIANPVFFLSTGFLIGKKCFCVLVGWGMGGGKTRISCFPHTKILADVYFVDIPLSTVDDISLSRQ